ncbi:unnamed protein product [Enterobius vermicularis]|uniref:MFS domain-containing protein n=1 Tax=Enterobius vermicularis TaxID=51028 RepID=A0A0N4VPW6_ENTVE|nr:unnamed protein product [Enterobius vermicularis]
MVKEDEEIPNTKVKPTNPPVLSWFVYFLAAMAVIGGFLFGYDTGIVSTAMLYIPDNGGMKPMNSIWKELVVSICPGMAAVGAVLAGPASDRFGRKKVIVVSSLAFVVGAVICAAAPEKITLLVGRIILGVAVGFASMTVPVYVGEASPANVRGRLVTSFQLMVTFGLVAANVIAGGFSYVNPIKVGWRLMFAFAAVPAVIQFVGFLFLPESPRWLFEHGDTDDSKTVLNRVYNHDKDWIDYELYDISSAYEAEKKSKESLGGQLPITRIFTTPHVRKALIIGCLLQAFQQFGGVNTLMYYTSTIIRSAGITDEHTTVWISAAISAINFFATFIPIWLVEKVGRRILLLLSVGGVFVALILMSIAFLLINKDSYPVITAVDLQGIDLNDTQVAKCNTYTNCDFCVTDENCGFCTDKTKDRTGYCLPISDDDSDYSTVGPCQNPINESVYGFGDNFCKSKYTPMPIVVMFFYLAFFAVGFAPLPWVMNAEFYPLWARSTSCSITTCVNWVANLIVSLTFLTLSEAVTKYGTFFIYAGITLVAFVFFFVAVPETSGYTIEEVELLFMSKKEKREALTYIELKKADQNGKENGSIASAEKY